MCMESEVLKFEWGIGNKWVREEEVAEKTEQNRNSWLWIKGRERNNWTDAIIRGQ